MKKFLKSVSILLVLGLFISLAMPVQTKVKAKDQSNERIKQTDQTETGFTADWTELTQSSWFDGYTIKGQTLLLFEGYSTKEGEEILNIPLGAEERSYTFEDLKPGTMYSVKYLVDYTYGTSERQSNTFYSSTFYTLPGKVTGVNQERWWYWAKNCDVIWDKQTGVDGYEYEVKNHKKKKVAKHDPKYNSGNRASFKIENHIVYTMKVRAYTELNGKKYKGEWSDTAYCFTQPMVNKVSYDKKGGMTLKWNKVNGTDEYSVYVSTKRDKGFKKVKTVKSKVTSMRLDKIGGKKISAKNTYYLYIVGTKKVKGKKYTSGKNYLHTIKNGYVQLGYIE